MINKPKIFRYQLDITDRQEIELPSRARILKVAPGRGRGYHLDLWALISPDPDHAVKLMFRVFGTGHPLPDFVGGFTYIDTVVMPDELVWHVFTETHRKV